MYIAVSRRAKQLGRIIPWRSFGWTAKKHRDLAGGDRVCLCPGFRACSFGGLIPALGQIRSVLLRTWIFMRSVFLLYAFSTEGWMMYCVHAGILHGWNCRACDARRSCQVLCHQMRKVNCRAGFTSLMSLTVHLWATVDEQLVFPFFTRPDGTNTTFPVQRLLPGSRIDTHQRDAGAKKHSRSTRPMTQQPAATNP